MTAGQYPQPHAEYSTDTVIYKGGPQQPQSGPQPGRGPLPSAEEEFPPPPPERGSNDASFNDSNSTTQSNVTSECSEAECDREPLVKQRGQWDQVVGLITDKLIYLSYSFTSRSF